MLSSVRGFAAKIVAGVDRIADQDADQALLTRRPGSRRAGPRAAGPLGADQVLGSAPEPDPKQSARPESEAEPRPEAKSTSAQAQDDLARIIAGQRRRMLGI